MAFEMEPFVSRPTNAKMLDKTFFGVLTFSVGNVIQAESKEGPIYKTSEQNSCWKYFLRGKKR